MHFIIEKTILLKPLQKLNSLLSINIENPILNNILLKVQSKYLFLISTNLEIELVSKIPCQKNYKNGSITVPGKRLLNIIRSFPNDAMIEIKIQGNYIKIFYQNIFFIISISESKNFPKFKTEDNIIEIFVSQKKIRDIIHNTQFSMAKQDVRNYLNGLYLEIKKNKISAITTDGYRMSISTVKIEQSIQNHSMIIPRKTITELIKILKETDDTFKMKVGKKMLQIYTKEYIISSKLIDHDFPDYKSILIDNFDQTIIINRNKLQSALNRAYVLSSNKSKGVKLTFNNQICTVSFHNEYEEKIQERFRINYSNKIIELTMNIHYIMEVINVIEENDIKILLNQSTNSIYIKNINEYYSTYIIMPLII
ncbi:DNA polymerase III subunit beta [Buchnera aphidicola]|uniref:DNA polymerase III subunit beta n=1 Tax=Buchnera aphidicola TaxID=9 RepID=UPI003463B60C